jgi:hypothetical protein
MYLLNWRMLAYVASETTGNEIRAFEQSELTLDDAATKAGQATLPNLETFTLEG